MPLSHCLGGEQQRVAILRALINEPSLILADEPTASLDEENRAMVMECLTQQVSDGDRGMVIVTHDSVVARYAHRMMRLSNATLTEVFT